LPEAAAAVKCSLTPPLDYLVEERRVEKLPPSVQMLQRLEEQLKKSQLWFQVYSEMIRVRL